MKHPRVTTMMFATLTLGMLAIGQPSDRDGTPEREPPQGRLTLELKIDPEALRIRLQRSIARSEDLLERHRAALEKLDSGASASDVLGELRSEVASRGGRSFGRIESDRKPESSPGAAVSPAGAIPDRDQIVGFLQSEFPKLWANLEPIVLENPRAADRLLERMAPQIREILYLQGTQPELAQLKTEQMHAGLDFVEAARSYKMLVNNAQADEDELAASRAQLEALAARRFDVDLRTKQHEVDRLEARLAELKESVQQIEERREREIAQMVASAERNAQRPNRTHRRPQNTARPDASGDD